MLKIQTQVAAAKPVLPLSTRMLAMNPKEAAEAFEDCDHVPSYQRRETPYYKAAQRGRPNVNTLRAY